jgi:hypothetical protein
VKTPNKGGAFPVAKIVIIYDIAQIIQRETVHFDKGNHVPLEIEGVA